MVKKQSKRYTKTEKANAVTMYLEGPEGLREVVSCVGNLGIFAGALGTAGQHTPTVEAGSAIRPNRGSMNYKLVYHRKSGPKAMGRYVVDYQVQANGLTQAQFLFRFDGPESIEAKWNQRGYLGMIVDPLSLLALVKRGSAHGCGMTPTFSPCPAAWSLMASKRYKRGCDELPIVSTPGRSPVGSGGMEF